MTRQGSAVSVYYITRLQQFSWLCKLSIFHFFGGFALSLSFSNPCSPFLLCSTMKDDRGEGAKKKKKKKKKKENLAAL
jgi:hypothetical protein